MLFRSPFPNGNEPYQILHQIDSGTADSATAFCLNDSGAAWGTGNGLVKVGDLVEETGSGTYATVTAVTGQQLTLDADIFPLGTENYKVYAVMGRGYATADTLDHLVDSTAKWADGADIFPAGTGNYELYHSYCLTHKQDPVTSFYGVTVDWSINITAGSTFYIYNYVAVSGTADTAPGNPLYDNDNTDFTTLGLLTSDLVFNYTNPAVANIRTVPYTIHPHAMDLSAGIFSTNDAYRILRFRNTNTSLTDIKDVGYATSNTSGSLVDSVGGWGTGAGPIFVGDIVYNVTTQQYAMVTNVADANLTLSWAISFTANDRYIILRQRGLLFVWGSGGNVVGSIVSINDHTVVYQAAVSFAGSNPVALSDGLGNAIVVYLNGGDIYARKLTGAGTTLWNTQIDTSHTGETIVKVISDTNGGVIVVYGVGANLYVQRISSAGALNWTVGGTAVGNPAAITGGDLDVIYDSISDDVYLATTISTDIWGARVDGGTGVVWSGYISNPAGASIQQKPKLYHDGTDLVVVWEDNRFLSFSGYGIFGIHLNPASGAVVAGWYADTTSADDDGVALILNNYNESVGNIQIMPYGAGTAAVLIWEDFRTAGEGCNLVYFGI